MTVIALVSAKGSPGVTTTAMALTIAWPHRVLLVEADPAGGDLLAGYLGGELGSRIGVTELAVAELRGQLTESFWGQMVDLDGSQMRRLLLPGVIDPAQSATVAAAWPAITDHFTALDDAEPPYDVIVDCGRLTAPHVPWPVLHAADVVLLLTGTTLPAVSHTMAALRLLRQPAHLGADPTAVQLLVRAPTGRRTTAQGGYRPQEVAAQLDVPLLEVLPEDPGTAAVVTGGGEFRTNAPLLRTARHLHPTLRDLINGRRARRHGRGKAAHVHV